MISRVRFLLALFATAQGTIIMNDDYKWDDPMAQEHLFKWVKHPEGLQKWNHSARHARHVQITKRQTGHRSLYRSSIGELLWLNESRKGTICQFSEAEQIVKESRLWLNYSTRAFNAAGKPPPVATAEERTALSHFFHHDHGFSRSHPGISEPIEPLHGVARHPFARTGCEKSPSNPHSVSKHDITYLIFYNRCGMELPKPRTFLFDLGASVGFQGVPGGLYTSAPTQASGKLCPSLPLFYKLYSDRCLEPDDIFAWEPQPKVSNREWFGELPPAVKAKIRYYKDSVDEGTLRAAAAPPGEEDGIGAPQKHPAASFLAILEAAVKPEDFVVVKVDIDTPVAELMIVEAIAEQPKIAVLIDELFFEYHFWYDGLDFGWGTKKVQGDVDSALALLRRLRELGIRAHFWI